MGLFSLVFILSRPWGSGWAVLCYAALLLLAVTQVQNCEHDESNANCITAACAQLELPSVEEIEFISFLSGHMQTREFERTYNGSKEKWQSPTFFFFLFPPLSGSGNRWTDKPLDALSLPVDASEDGIPVAKRSMDNSSHSLSELLKK